MSSRDDDKRRPGDRTEVVAYDEAAKRKLSSAPRRLGRYTLDRIIAHGGMAEIWLATVEGPARFSKKVVVKRIRPSLVKAARRSQDGVNTQVEMFVREARLLASLEHRNIVQVIELGIEEGSTAEGVSEHYIVMEYLEGLTLRDLALRVWQAKRALPLELVVRAVADGCLGLSHAHQLRDERGQPAHLVHRDISPDNLFLTTAGVTKLLDFGIAKREDWAGLTVAGELKGKVPYMAPEHLRGERIDARADLFSVGVVLYWLLTGRRPFDGPSDVFTMKAILDEAPRPLRQLNPQVPARLEEVVLACLEKDPTRRISSAAAVHDSLSMLMMGLPGAAPVASDVVAAGLALPLAPYELVPDVAAVPVLFWSGPGPSLITASRAASPLPEGADVSQARTIQMTLEGRPGPVDVGALPGMAKTVVGDDNDADAETLLPSTEPPPSEFTDRASRVGELSAGSSPGGDEFTDGASRVGELSTGSSRLPGGGEMATDPRAPGSLGLSSIEAPAPVDQGAGASAVVDVDAPTQQRRASWKEQIPIEMRDTVELDVNEAQEAAGPPAPPVAVTASPELRSSMSGRTASGRRSPKYAGGIAAVIAGAGAALVVVVLLAMAIGALPNPLLRPTLRSPAPVVVPVAPPAPEVIGAAAVADAGIADVDAGIASALAVGAVPAVTDAGVSAGGSDAGTFAIDEDDQDTSPVKRRKRSHPRAPAASVVAGSGEGLLVVRVRSGVKLSLDGLSVGTTPLPALSLPPGKHRLNLEQGVLAKTVFVDVKRGETTSVQVELGAP